MSDDESMVNLDIIRGAGTNKETIIGGACFDSQAVLNGSAQAVSTLMPSGGYWEEQTLYTDLGVPLITQTVWVLGPAMTVAAPSSLPSSGTAPPMNYTTAGAIYLSRDGASATLPDGQVINAGVGGRLELSADGNLSATRPVPGYSRDEAVYSVTLYSKGGQVIANTQVQVVADPAHPNDPAYNTTVVQGQARDIAQTLPDGSSTVVKTAFQTGLGWVEQGTGEIVQSIAQWTQERSAQAAAPTSAGDFYRALLEVFQNPQTPSGQDEQYAGVTSGTASDAGGGTGADTEPNDYSYINYLRRRISVVVERRLR